MNSKELLESLILELIVKYNIGLKTHDIRTYV